MSNPKAFQALTVDYELVYGKPAPRIEDLLLGIDKIVLAKSGSHFLGLFRKSKKFDPKDIVTKIFGEENREFATKAYDRLTEIKNEFDTITFFHPLSSLQLIEYSIILPDTNIEISDVEIERRIFDAYLALNFQRNEYENRALKYSEEADSDEEKLFRAVLGSMFPTHELVNYNFRIVIISHFYRSILLYKKLDSDERFKPLLKCLYKKFHISDWQEYLSKLLVFTFYTNENKENSFTTLKINPSNQSEKLFIEEFLNNRQDNEGKEDFLALRNKPLIKISDDTVLIPFDLFLVEKVFKGQYFVLNEINKNLPKTEKFSNFRGIFCDVISERTVFYEILTNAFNKWPKSFNGEQIKATGIIAEPDFYCRDGNNILIFESKDVLIRADTKHSYSIPDIITEINEKLIFDSRDKSNKAVKQLISQIEVILNGGFPVDRLPKAKGDKTKPFHIFPILVIHDRQLTVPGIEYYLRRAFINEIINLENKGYPVRNVRSLVVLNIDSLLVYQTDLRNKKLRLPTIIDEYLGFLKKQKKPFNREEAFDLITKPFLSFDNYFLNKAEYLSDSISNKMKEFAKDVLK